MEDIKTEAEFEEALREALLTHEEEFENFLGIKDMYTFEEGAVLTRNKGLVVRLHNGAEFQLTIVRSKSPGQGEEF